MAMSTARFHYHASASQSLEVCRVFVLLLLLTGSWLVPPHLRAQVAQIPSSPPRDIERDESSSRAVEMPKNAALGDATVPEIPASNRLFSAAGPSDLSPVRIVAVRSSAR